MAPSSCQTYSSFSAQPMPCTAPPLHLPLDVAGVDGGASVLDDGEAEDVDFARLGVNLNVDDVAGEGGAHTRGVRAGGGADGTARTQLLRRDPPSS